MTYVPGTFTSTNDFFSGGVQQVAQWMDAKTDHTVIFVWKDGTFPGENTTVGGMNLARIGEANDEDAALKKGRDLARFEYEISASSPDVAAARHDAIGHSWGVAAIAASEVAGAHFDQVHSLAGAGLPSDWTPQDGTRYFHWSYEDLLSMAQSTGWVWNGKIPRTDPAFESHILPRDGDFSGCFDMRIGPDGPAVPEVPCIPFEGSFDAIDNHSLIASSDPANEPVLRHVLEKLRQ